MLGARAGNSCIWGAMLCTGLQDGPALKERRAACERPSGKTHDSVTWLILPVVICLSQKLSHASLSLSCLQRNCRRLIISVIVYTTGRIAIWITVVILELIHAKILFL
jgi:hypothetical protein